MNMKIAWLVWFLVFVIGGFATLEGYAIESGRQTLSRCIWELNAAWPAFGPVFGAVVGFLICHFFWGGIVAFRPVGRLMVHMLGS